MVWRSSKPAFGASVVRALAAGSAAALCALLHFGADASAAPKLEEEALDEVFAAAAAPAGSNHCAIVLVREGGIRANVGNTELTSQNFGGWPAEANVTASNSSYSLSIDPVLGFTTAPAGSANGTVFSPSYNGDGATSFTETPGNIPIRIKRGQTQVRINFLAQDTANPFSAGDYRAELILRCE